METPFFLVANPPHRDTDMRRAADRLGMSPADVRIKATYPAPEIWLADPNRAELEDVAGHLGQAGLNVVILDAGALGAIPARANVRSFVLTDTDLVCVVDGAEAPIPNDAPVFSVFGRPREEGPAVRGSSGLAEGLRRSSGVFMTRDSLTGLGAVGRPSMASATTAAPGGTAFLDLYVRAGETVQRFGLMQDAVDFAGLKDRRLARATDNIAMLVAECEERFRHGAVDRRLVDLPPRPRLIAGKTVRQGDGYTYAPVAFLKMLEAIAPSLKDVGQFDLTSRLAFLTGTNRPS